MSAVNKKVKDWIDKANHDLGSAKLIYLHIPDYFDTIAFHCQQATEKYLKSILEYYGIEFQRSHNLVYLLDLLAQRIDIAENIYDKAIMLNGFSVQIRYPDNTIYLTKEELETSISISQEFRDFAIKTIGIKE
ncbi:MAG: HEPN domain-containing protein [Bacteroidetes bacterium]|nr:HEPN domain-containing protein [Bacteroidota bacterium]MCL6101538.1 HEPN domain-containing protein [Bacteroidota bacterium]